MKFHPPSATHPDKDEQAGGGTRRAELDWIRVELFPGRPYCVRHTLAEHTLGVAIERQRGVHAFGSDQHSDFDTWTGAMAYTPAGLETYSESDAGGEYLLLRFAGGPIRESWNEAPRWNPRPSLFGQRRALELALRMRRALLGAPTCTNTVQDLAAQMMVAADVAFARRPRGSADREIRDHARLRLVLDRIESELGSSLRLPELAAVAQMPLLPFLRCFTRAIGLTPHAYLMERRAQRARRMLEDRRLSLAEIAAECGFSHQSHMGVALARAFGMTPKRLRSMLAGDAAQRLEHG
jgi:AraC family transcriptional regulator